jgi:hypothetical protein
MMKRVVQGPSARTRGQRSTSRTGSTPKGRAKSKFKRKAASGGDDHGDMSGGSDTEEYGSDGRKVKKPKPVVSSESRSAALERYLAQWDRLDAMAPGAEKDAAEATIRAALKELKNSSA